MKTDRLPWQHLSQLIFRHNSKITCIKRSKRRENKNLKISVESCFQKGEISKIKPSRVSQWQRAIITRDSTFGKGVFLCTHVNRVKTGLHNCVHKPLALGLGSVFLCAPKLWDGINVNVKLQSPVPLTLLHRAFSAVDSKIEFYNILCSKTWL